MSIGNVMNWSANLLPATVTAAILLFIARETLEWFRRRKANRRKVNAMKRVLARECELNLWTMNSLKEALETALKGLTADPPGRIKITRAPSGNEHWEYRHSVGFVERSGSLPSVRRSTMEGLALGLAELDRRAFIALERALEATAELDHLRGTLINFADDADPVDKDFFGAFLEWALEQFDQIYSGLNALHVVSTGSQLVRARLR